MNTKPEHLEQPVLTVARRNVATLGQDLTVQQALEAIRNRELAEEIVYFYVVDDEGRLAGVVPARRLLTAALDQRLREIMLVRVVAIPQTATLLEACEAFVMHKFLAFPVVDEERRILGVVDVNFFKDEVFDIAGGQEEIFEALGFHVAQLREASPWRAFRFRFPWLLATIASGTACAFLASAFHLTLARSLILAFFLTLVLGLAESVSIQSMTLTIQALRATEPTRRWYLRAFRREAGTALLLGLGCGSEHRDQPAASPVHGLPVRPQHSGGIARFEARSEDCRRPGNPGLHGPVHAPFLLGGSLAVALSRQGVKRET
jgi:magnesium transporter